MTEDSELHTLRIVTGNLEENCYVLWRDPAAGAIVIDPGDEAERIDRAIKARDSFIAAFVQTHCHFDHIGALEPLKKLYPNAPLYVPEEEVEWLSRPTLNLSYFCGGSITAPNPDHIVRHDDVLEIIGITLKSRHVPGHSPGSTAYFVEDEASSVVVCGDTLFKDGIGRTDLPGGAGEEVLIEEIRTKLFTLPDRTVVLPGHGPRTTIGIEKTSNPFCRID